MSKNTNLKFRSNELFICLIVLLFFIGGWIPSITIGKLAWIELFFLLCSIIPILFLGTESGLVYIRKIMGDRYVGLKLFAMMFFVLDGYLIFTKINLPPLAQDIDPMPLAIIFHYIALEYLPLTIIPLVALPFFILYVKRNKINEPNISGCDVLILFIICIFSYLQMNWISKTFNDFLNKNVLFYLHFIFTLWAFVILPLVLFLVLRRFDRKRIGFLLNIRWKDFKYFLIALPVCVFIYTLWPPPFKPSLSSFNDLPLLMLRVTYNIFVIALPFELLYRGLFLNIIEQKLRTTKFCEVSTTYAVVISSFLYALAHYWNGPGAIITQFFMGIGFALVFLRTKSLVAPVLIHSFLSIIADGAPILWK